MVYRPNKKYHALFGFPGDFGWGITRLLWITNVCKHNKQSRYAFLPFYSYAISIQIQLTAKYDDVCMYFIQHQCTIYDIIEVHC